MSSGTGSENLTLVSQPRVELGLHGLALKGAIPLGPVVRALGVNAGVVARNHQKRGVRFASLLKPTGDPMNSASALR